MSDDYLWDRSGPPDPEVERLERLLRPLGHDGPVVIRRASFQAPPPVRPPITWGALPLAAGLLLALIAGLLWELRRDTQAGRAFAVGRLEGRPVISSRAIADRDVLPVGAALETGAGGRARIDVADIGYVDVDPATRVQLVRSDGDQYRLRLDRGTMHARISAPPGQFIVDTPSSTAIDLGCAYTLEVDERGSGHVHVTSGWVGFEWRGRESLIPAGAMCETRPGVGPGTPYYSEVSEAFQQALETLDFSSLDAPQRDAALARVLAEARTIDGLTLWHLLTRGAASERARVYDRFAQLVPPPDGVTRDGVLRGHRAMLDRWWRELGLGDAASWREWKQSGEGVAR